MMINKKILPVSIVHQVINQIQEEKEDEEEVEAKEEEIMEMLQVIMFHINL